MPLDVSCACASPRPEPSAPARRRGRGAGRRVVAALAIALLGPLVVVFPARLPAATASSLAGVAPARVAEIAAWLPARPSGIGPRIEDRAAFDNAAWREDRAGVLERAEALLRAPMPPWNDEDYLDFSRTGQRPRGEAMFRARTDRLAPLVWAECLEDRGRFLPAIEETLRSLARQPCWTAPAHDVRLDNFYGRAAFVDLTSASLAHDLAQTLHLLESRLAPAVRAEVVAALQARVWDAVIATLRGENQLNWWLRATSNWNAVCLAGVTGSALAACPGREDRALLVAAAEAYGRNTLRGFTDDGYCSEGLGYWMYGFGHYARLREALHQGTGGRLDLFADPKVREIALFGARMEMLPGVFPAIADCRFETRVNPGLLAGFDRIFGLGLQLAAPPPPAADERVASLAFLRFSAHEPVGFQSAARVAPPLGEPRSYFPQAGVLVCRPSVPDGLAAVLKGGHNAEHHNHNDVGSFSLGLGEALPVADPGGPHTYTSETFGPLRYTKFDLFRSRNHPVPLPDGAEQTPGRAAAAQVRRADFGPRLDVFDLDLTRAYPAGRLRTLTRRFVFSREGRGELRVLDTFVFDAPATFETSLTTPGTWERSGERSLRFTHRGETVLVDVLGDLPFELTETRIEENAPAFLRVGLRLRGEHRSGVLELRFRPTPRAQPAARSPAQ